jgi:hypothetical protein
MDIADLPEIITLFDGAVENTNSHLYRHAIRSTLKQILPFDCSSYTNGDLDHSENLKQEFHSSLPIFLTSPCEIAPANMSFYMLSKHRYGAFKFFLEMISKWLIPGKSLNVVTSFVADFQIPAVGEDTLTLCEVMIHVDNQAEMDELLRNLPIIETELKFGMQSSHYARRVLTIRGLSADAKTASIQEDIAYLISRRPNTFDYDLLTEMQHTLVMCRDEFKAEREIRHFSRIICLQYIFRKELREAVKQDPEKRHLRLKLFKSVLNLQEENKRVLGIVVGINFLKDKEVFEERHLLSAIQNYIPAAHAVEGSFFSNKRGHENIGTLYLEIEKPNAEAFTTEEIQLLRRELPSDLKDRIEHLLHPIFMPRNEEEIMRNILTLSSQIKYLYDLPQVIISFDQQTHSDLYFTIILVAAMKPGALSIQDKFKAANTFLGYTHDRTKTIGLLRKKYTKDASVFNIKISKYQFLRRDHSIDLGKARQTILAELTRIFGDIRDFNGGMISKQHELLCALREQLQDKIKYDDLLLENFFYSLTPDVMRTVLSPQSLESLFLLLHESIEENFFEGANYIFKIQKDSQYLFAMIKTEDRNVKEMMSRALNKFDTSPAAMASSFVLVYDIAYMGYLYLNHDPVEQDKFCSILEDVLKGQ